MCNSFVKRVRLPLLLFGPLFVATPAWGATATFTPVGPSSVEPGTNVVFEVTVSTATLAEFDTADILIGSDAATDIDFAYSAEWTAAFANVTPPVFDTGSYPQDVFVGGNNATPVGASLLLGTVTVTTTGMSQGTFNIVIDNSFDGVSTLGLAGQPEALSGDGAFTILAQCAVDEDCNDSKDCTDDVCTANGCDNPILPAATECRPSADECDLAEFCSGLVPDCPPDEFLADGTPCTDDGIECTVDECRGSVCAHEGQNCAPNAPILPPPPHDFAKNRFISFDPNNETPVGFRIELLDLACAGTGKKCALDADCKACSGGQNTGLGCSINSDCPGGLCQISGAPCAQKSAPMVLGWVGDPIERPGESPVGTFTSLVNANQPAPRLWTEPVVHIGDCEIAPVETYALRSTADGVSFSDPLILATIEKPQGKSWGDLVGSFDGVSWGAPNVLVNVDDVVAMIQFITLRPAPHITVVELLGSADDYINFIINAGDLQMVLEGFSGKTYPPIAYVDYPARLVDCP